MTNFRLRILVLFVLALSLFSGCKSDPKAVRDKNYKSAQKYFDDRRYDEAVIEYRNALKVDNGHIPSYLGLDREFLQA